MDGMNGRWGSSLASSLATSKEVCGNAIVKFEFLALNHRQRFHFLCSFLNCSALSSPCNFSFLAFCSSTVLLCSFIFVFSLSLIMSLVSICHLHILSIHRAKYTRAAESREDWAGGWGCWSWCSIVIAGPVCCRGQD